MDLFAVINPLLVVSGFVVGMLVGLTGVGGGSLMTPILVLLFGVHATTAVGLAANEMEFFGAGSRKLGSHETPRWRGESTANSSLKLGADSGRVMDDSGTVKRCFPLEFRRKLSSLPWQPAPHSDS